MQGLPEGLVPAPCGRLGSAVPIAQHSPVCLLSLDELPKVAATGAGDPHPAAWAVKPHCSWHGLQRGQDNFVSSADILHRLCEVKILCIPRKEFREGMPVSVYSKLCSVIPLCSQALKVRLHMLS